MRAIILYGALCLACVAFVACVRGEERRPALATVAAFGVNWTLYVLSWSPVPPASLFWAVGLPLSSEHLWTIQDAVFGAVAIALGWRWWWGWALLAIVCVEEAVHAGFDFGWYGFERYADLLNNGFLAMVACFLLMGGGHVRDRGADFLRRGGDAVRQDRAALRREER